MSITDDPTPSSTHRPPATVKRAHPVRGIVWGLLFGIGLAAVLVITTVISLDLLTVVIVVVAATIVGVLWSIFGPATPPKGPPPTPKRPAPPTPSRFDDFDPPAPETTATEPSSAPPPPTDDR
jgi:hypothetical protein